MLDSGKTNIGKAIKNSLFASLMILVRSKVEIKIQIVRSLLLLGLPTSSIVSYIWLS